MLLTDAKLKGAKPKERAFRLKDGGGLFLIVRPNGAKFWQFRYRFLDKEKTISLGKYPQTSLSEAREKRATASKHLENGIDPSVNRRKEKLLAAFREKNTFFGVAEEWHRRNKDVWSRKHSRDTWRRLENHVFPSLGKRPIQDIEPLELLAVIHKVEATGTTDISHRVLQICGAIFKYAIITGRVKYNIAVGLSSALKPHRKKHSPTLNARELPGFLQALADLDTSQQNKLAFHLLLLTAVRTGELRFGRWKDVDFRCREWRIPAEKTKMRTEHIVPLSSQAISVLIQLHNITGQSEWLVPTQCGYRHPVMSENTINGMIDRMGYKGRVVGHGFRSLFSTTLNERGFNRDAIERQLAHMERNGVRASYNHAEYLDERRFLMQWWGDFLDSQMKEQNLLHWRSSGQSHRYHPPTSRLHAPPVCPDGDGRTWETFPPSFPDTTQSGYRADDSRPRLRSKMIGS